VYCKSSKKIFTCSHSFLLAPLPLAIRFIRSALRVTGPAVALPGAAKRAVAAIHHGPSRRQGTGQAARGPSAGPSAGNSRAEAMRSVSWLMAG
jgi:hypothetical protein